MKCMKCGTGIPSGQVFCEECLTDMEKHPVKPGTPVILPRRDKPTQQKRSRRRTLKPEELIAKLRRAVVWLMVLCAVLAIALTLCVYMLFNPPATDNPANLPGQNYGTSVPAE